MKARGPRSQATKALLAFIREQQPVSHQDLSEKFRSTASATGMSISSWLSGRLNNMRSSGFIDHRPEGWVALDVSEQPAPKQTKGRRTQAPGEPQALAYGSVALPRRVQVMEGAYVPPASQVHRAGALDYASKPSLINGRPRTYRSGM